MLWNMSAFPLPTRLACKLFFIAETRLNWIQSFVFFFNSPWDPSEGKARHNITGRGGGGRNNRGTPRHQSIWPRRGHAICFSIDQLVIGLPRLSHEWRKTVDELKWNKRALKKRWHVLIERKNGRHIATDRTRNWKRKKMDCTLFGWRSDMCELPLILNDKRQKCSICQPT